MTDSSNPKRTCATCACYARIKEDGTIAPTDGQLEAAQPSCRRFGPMAQLVRVDVPVLDKVGNPVRDAKGQPRTQPGQAVRFAYAPTRSDLVCFDGWRPADTQPGELSRWLAALNS